MKLCISPVGAEAAVWSGKFVSDGIALMACVPLNGFFAVASYQNGRDLYERYPLLYTQTPGRYTCTVSLGDVVKVFHLGFQDKLLKNI